MPTQIWSARRHNFLSFRPFFCSFAPLLAPKIKIWKKLKKKTPGNIILLHMCTINQDICTPDMMYGSWYMKFNVPLIKIICTPDMMNGSWDMKFHRTILSSWQIFCSFIPLTTQKMIISKMKKNQNKWRYRFTQLYQKP